MDYWLGVNVMGVLNLPVYYVLEVLKWIILARVLVSWLPMFGIRLDRYNPIVRFIYQLTDPILRPLQRFTRVGMMDLSPIIAFFLIGFLQRLMVGQSIARTIAFALVLLVAFSVHEFAHAWVAYRLGDPTAKNQGRLTLDPRKHLDVLGSIMVLAVGFGWAKPVPVNPYNLRNGSKAGMAMVAAAGPLSNLLLAFAAAIPLRLGLIGTYYISNYLPNPQQLFLTFVWLNVALLFFNLLPIAPLDGFKVVAGLLPYPSSESFRKLEPVGPVILLILVFLGGRVFTSLIMGPTNFVVGLLT
jgi:Zn-dependent protease